MLYIVKEIEVRNQKLEYYERIAGSVYRKGGLIRQTR